VLFIGGQRAADILADAEHVDVRLEVSPEPMPP
jgi:hypothetical protein